MYLFFVTALDQVRFWLCVTQNEQLTNATFVKLKQAYGDHYLSRHQFLRWHKSFLEGRKHIVEVEHRLGRPKFERVYHSSNFD